MVVIIYFSLTFNPMFLNSTGDNLPVETKVNVQVFDILEIITVSY